MQRQEELTVARRQLAELEETLTNTLLTPDDIHAFGEREAIEQFPLYVPIENRDETYVANEALDDEVEMMILEIIDEIEENDDIKVSEYVEIDEDFDFGISLEAALYVAALEEEVIEKFISDFNSNSLKLDSSLYSFKTEEE